MDTRESRLDAMESRLDARESRLVELDDTTESRLDEARESRRLCCGGSSRPVVRDPVESAPECCEVVETRRDR